MIGGNPVHLFGLLGHTPEKIPSAHHDRDLNIKRLNVRQLSRDFVDAKRIDAKALSRGESLAGKFEQDAFEDGSCHDFVRSDLAAPAATHKKRGAIERPSITRLFV